MQIEYLSASRLETYLQCPRKYYYVYEKGYDTSSDNTRFGSLMHSILEHILTVEPAPADPLEYAKEKFKNNWPQYGIMTADYFTTGYALLEKFFLENDYLDWRQRIIDTPEKQFELKLNDEAKVIGFIDLPMQKDPETLLILDFKTSVVPKTEDEAKADVQMSIYYLAGRELYPQYKNIELTLYYLRHGPVTTTRPDDFALTFKDYLLARYYQIKNDTEARPIPSALACAYCPGRHECDALTSSIQIPSTIEEMVATYEAIKAQINALNSRKEEISKLIQQHLDFMDVHNLQVENKQVSLVTPRQLKYDVYSVYKALGLNDFLKVVSIEKKALEKLLKNDNKRLAKAREGAKYEYSTPYIKISNVKNFDVVNDN
jgi:RecB family exonuclease